MECFLRQNNPLPPTPYCVVLVNGILRMEAGYTLKLVASCLIKQWKQTYYWTCGYTNSRVSITLVRSTHCCIRVSWVPYNNISVQ